VEKAGERKLHRRVERGEDEREGTTSATKRERERERERPRQSPGREKLRAMARLVEHYLSPYLPPFRPLSLSPVKTRIFHSDVLAACRVTIAAVNEDAAIKYCCRTEIAGQQKGISAFTRAKCVSSFFFLWYIILRHARQSQPIGS